ncbi:hypothetical protein SY88_01550 [Clostridiales bacterium PH28_bin88]|nr:hypothetical protein SY88_01550 [Clostridiales bacterium PH28_bin88]
MEVRGTAVVTGNGIVVHLFGGELPHVGSIVVSQPRPSLQAGGGTSCTSSTLNLVGHKDDELARPVAEMLSRKLNQVVVVVAGVHVDAATAQEIRQLSQHGMGVAKRLLEQITDSG